MTFIERSQPYEGLDPSDVARTFSAELQHLMKTHKRSSHVLKEFKRHTMERIRLETQNERYKAEYLRGIESSSDNLRHYAERLGSYVRALTFTPPYDTAAEHNMEKAEKELKDALLKVQASRAQYAILPKTEDVKS